MSRARLLLRLFLLIALLAVSERLLFAVRHPQLTGQLDAAALAEALLTGLRFDLALAAIAFALAHLSTWAVTRLLRLPFEAALRAIGSFVLLLLVLLHGADALYYAEAGRHLGYELKEGLNSAGDLLPLLFGRYLNELLLQLALLAPLLFAVRRLLRSDAPRARSLLLEAELLLSLLLAVLIARGGLQSIPLEPLRAQALGNSVQATLALNGAYNALHALGARSGARPLVPIDPLTPDEREALRALYASRPERAGEPRPLNVILLLLESWSGAFALEEEFAQPVAPELAQLRTRGLTTRAMLAGGHRTTEGMFATLCSAQNPLGGTVAQTELQQYPYRCLPHLLRERGYRTAFFQGTHENTSGTGDFARLLGFTESYARETIAEHKLPLNGWGLQDPDIYEFVLRQARIDQRPFLFAINTNSTHDLALPPGWEPRFPGADLQNRYLSVLHFADRALGDFARTLAREGMLDNTVLVIQADHPGLAPERNPQRYLIPFALLSPALAPARLDTVATQRDVAPTLLDLLGLPPAPQFTGRSLLTGAPGGADYYHAGRLGWFEGARGVELPVSGEGAIGCMAAAAGFPQRECDVEDARIGERARAFTRAEQTLLFEGKTTGFGALAGR